MDAIQLVTAGGQIGALIYLVQLFLRRMREMEAQYRSDTTRTTGALLDTVRANTASTERVDAAVRELTYAIRNMRQTIRDVGIDHREHEKDSEAA